MAKKYSIHRNVIEKKKILFFPRANLVQAILITVPWLLFLKNLPFLLMPKVILMLSTGIFLFLFFGIGIKHRSVLKFISDFIKSRSEPQIYHLRSIKDVKTNRLNEDGEITELTYAEQIKTFIKEKFSKKEN